MVKELSINDRKKQNVFHKEKKTVVCFCFTCKAWSNILCWYDHAEKELGVALIRPGYGEMKRIFSNIISWQKGEMILKSFSMVRFMPGALMLVIILWAACEEKWDVLEI